MVRSPTEKTILIIALLGMLLSGYAIPLHYDVDGDSFCDISDKINCDKVNTSPWSELFGIPVAILGLLSYLGVFLVVWKKEALTKLLSFTKKDFWQYFLVGVTGMFLFQAYLTYVEIFWIKAICLVCIGSQILVLLLLILSFMQWKK